MRTELVISAMSCENLLLCKRSPYNEPHGRCWGSFLIWGEQTKYIFRVVGSHLFDALNTSFFIYFFLSNSFQLLFKLISKYIEICIKIILIHSKYLTRKLKTNFFNSVGHIHVTITYCNVP